MNRWFKIEEEIKSCRDVDEALDLFRTNYGGVISPNSIDEAFYPKSLRKSAEWLVSKNPSKTISVLCDIFDSVLERNYKRTSPEDDSLNWLWDWIPDRIPDPQIIQQPQQTNLPIPQKLALVQALYLVSRKAVLENLLSLSEVLSILQPRKWRVYRRLECKLCLELGDAELKRKMILDKEKFCYCFLELSYPLLEYFELFKANFKKLEEGDKEQIRAWMEELLPCIEQKIKNFLDIDQSIHYTESDKKLIIEVNKRRLRELVEQKDANLNKEEKKIVEISLVKRLLYALRIQTDGELLANEKPDVKFEINGRRIGVEVTVLHPDEGDRGSRARIEEEREVRTACARNYFYWIIQDEKLLGEALRKRVKDKIKKDKSYQTEDVSELWLLVAASIPLFGAIRATAVGYLSLDQLKQSIGDLLEASNNPFFNRFYFYSIFNKQLYSWDRDEGWKELRV
ncbi:hypothetical protein EM20IM_04825 [Candidatus Methylacidiphilum infernorum]|uniref:Uncharacterized protein n=1 Tax=Candidatus Methylacidiphilum infernorum TaxID=511746 RepID=A0ABX7PY66_9BACT|nr:hypothetical protein [Candidatus Methylacidiphilum infernorum]QSR87644.1 hypothetical protein EM20IM_04825 [Candidatus Methylacidiphilum infernorum]